MTRLSNAARLFLLTSAVFLVASFAHGQTFSFSTLRTFKNNNHDPNLPSAALVVDGSGNLYGTSTRGGTQSAGTLFKISKTGALTILYNFVDVETNGSNPWTSVARDKSGNLYGTAPSCCLYRGVVYKVTPTGKESVVFYFPEGGLGAPADVILDSAGNLYGNALDSDLVWEIEKSGQFDSLYTFCFQIDCVDGDVPQSKLVRDAGGNLFGVTNQGGASGNGTVFKITPAGVETVLHNFDGTDGANPYGLKQDSAGNLYGTTGSGGHNNAGTIYKITESGASFTTLYNFCSISGCSDGQGPIGSVQIDSAGNIFGAAVGGAALNGSLIWELSSSGKETVLHSFSPTTELGAGITIDSAGNLYGVTFDGGASAVGTVFKLTRK